MIDEGDLDVGGGSGGLPIGFVASLIGTKKRIEDTSGGVWLKSGVIDDDITLYPDAQVIGLPLGDKIESIYLSPSNSTYDCFAYRDNKYYTIASTSSVLTESDAKGIATGLTVPFELGYLLALASDDTNFYAWGVQGSISDPGNLGVYTLSGALVKRIDFDSTTDASLCEHNDLIYLHHDATVTVFTKDLMIVRAIPVTHAAVSHPSETTGVVVNGDRLFVTQGGMTGEYDIENNDELVRTYPFQIKHAICRDGVYRFRQGNYINTCEINTGVGLIHETVDPTTGLVNYVKVA